MQCPSTAVVVTPLRVIFIFLQVDNLIEWLECHEYIPMHEIRQHQNEVHGTKRRVLLPTSDPSLIFSEYLSLSNAFARVRNHCGFYLTLTTQTCITLQAQSSSSRSSSFYSHLFNYDITKLRDRKEVKNRADYTLS